MRWNRQFADSYRQIGTEIDKSIGKLEVNLDPRIGPHVIRDDPYEEIRTEQNWCAHAQDA
ncbi:hypothetical protein X743_14545 [Mesorhizobium sp. LNHC252B00]|nr:hypothetical protein X743_14545 [Mesorhizobium sp. LNHC252B00]